MIAVFVMRADVTIVCAPLRCNENDVLTSACSAAGVSLRICGSAIAYSVYCARSLHLFYHCLLVGPQELP